MPRATTVFIVFFVAMNLFAGVFLTTGIAAGLGMDERIQPSDEVSDTVDERRAPDGGEINTGAGTGATLFGMYNAVLGGFIGLFENVLPALQMLTYAGVPRWITGTLVAGMFGIVASIDGLSYIRGYDL